MKNKTKDRIIKYILVAIVLLFALAFVVKFGGPAFLRMYIEYSFGDCKKLPILCLASEKETIPLTIDRKYLSGLLKYELPDLEIYIPEGFTIIKEKITKVRYKKNKRLDKGAVIYLLYERPYFFTDLFPQLSKQGIKNNHDFLSRVMSARTPDIKTPDDTFFVIMKSIFIPNLGEAKPIRMVRFAGDSKKGFINYSLSRSVNYFDCNILNDKDDFFKIYIKDAGAKLDLAKVLAIISTVKKTK